MHEPRIEPGLRIAHQPIVAADTNVIWAPPELVLSRGRLCRGVSYRTSACRVRAPATLVRLFAAFRASPSELSDVTARLLYG